MNKNGWRFTDEDKLEMNRLRLAGLPVQAIADKFGTTHQTVWSITKRYISPRLREIGEMSALVNRVVVLSSHLSADEEVEFTRCSGCFRLAARVTGDLTYGCARCGAKPIAFATVRGVGELLRSPRNIGDD